MREKTGLLLLNLGTPTAPSPKEVEIYLREFLMDPYVIDIPNPFRWFLVNWLILPKRSKSSAVLYRKIWRRDGSPLLHFTREFAEKVRHQVGDKYVVKFAMRYGSPSIANALKLLKSESIQRLIVFPLYPQYSLAATASSQDKVQQIARAFDLPEPEMIPAFYDDAVYLDAVTEVSRPYLDPRGYDLALFSFHGLPERQVKKTEVEGRHCLRSNNCCDRIPESNPNCYRAQCYATARALASRLGIPAERYRVCFQSRLGRTPWIQPFTDEFYRTLPKQGVKRIAVLCPSFVADCLETLEEVCIRGREEFLRNGGEDLFLVPSLNCHDAWVKAVESIVDRRAGLSTASAATT